MNKPMTLILIGLFVVVVIGAIGFFALSCDAACEAERSRDDVQPYTHIAPDEFYKQMSGASVIDVRTPEEFVEGHLPGAALIDIYADDFKNRIGQLDRDGVYYVYCRSGNRSQSALDIMKKAGFTNVYGLQGGITAWQRSGLPIE